MASISTRSRVDVSSCYLTEQQNFLNQVGTSQRPAHTWFLKIVLSRKLVCMFVCPPMRLLITSGVIRTPCHWLHKFYSFYMAAAVNIISRCGLRNEARHRNQSNKNTLAMYKPLLSL